MTLGLLTAPGDPLIAIWTLAALSAALILDAALGEPEILWRRVPHPAVLMGRAVAWADRRFNAGAARRLRGVAAILGLSATAAAIGWAAAAAIGPVLSVLGAAVLLAARSLDQHVSAVADALDDGLTEGRRAVSMIVGRDPETLDRDGVARAAIESGAENFSDGVVAPALAFAALGLPGIVAYKMINTADSMIGHRTERHRAFGWASARVDDALNLLPARLSAALIALAGRRSLSALRIAWRDARVHASPNAGWPEAAMAGALGLALAGPRSYGGVMTEDAYLNPAGRRAATSEDVRASVRRLRGAWIVLFASVGFGLAASAIAAS